MVRSREAPGMCGHQWTTGYGPGDPADTGVHLCGRSVSDGHTEHLCECGSVASADPGIDGHQ